MLPVDMILLLMLLIGLGLFVYILLNWNHWLAWRRERAVRKVLPCSLTAPLGPFPAECLGTCLDGEGACTTVETRSYLIFWRQAARCACVKPVEPGSTPPGHGGIASPGPSGP